MWASEKQKLPYVQHLAMADNKQVAVLVPTTVLAYQHYQTFCKRLEGMLCKVEYLSRARTAKDTSRIYEGARSWYC